MYNSFDRYTVISCKYILLYATDNGVTTENVITNLRKILKLVKNDKYTLYYN